jgi:NhaA family Na+:H+ antiporter
MINPLKKAKRSVTATASDFFRMEAAAGILLMIFATLAIIIANTPLHSAYEYFFEKIYLTIGFSAGEFDALFLSKPLLLWINDGFMAIFFFLVGLEIKREFVSGELSSRDRAFLPIVAAIGGMAVPALIYYFLNQNDPIAVHGWAIPAATDIAFALGILALLGSRAPTSLKILLTAIAVIDDLGAIMIIALFYTSQVNVMALIFAAVAVIGLICLNRMRVVCIAPYILIGFILWFAVLKSGVHATLAGVFTALFIPMVDPNKPDYSPLKHLEHALHPWVAFMILPIFAFANAGVSFHGMTWESLTNSITLGIIGGLFVGKQVGIFLIMLVVIGLGLSPKPKDTSWLQLYAVSILCGVGFTMSLFIGELAFETREQADAVRMGVIAGSLACALLGYLILRFAPNKKG